MTEICILQVGDIHFPTERHKKIADLKDDRLPASFVDKFAPTRMQKVLEDITRKADKIKFHGILICGDLTDKGDLGGYQECVNFLNDNLQLKTFTQEQLHVVPGNHDLNRKALQPGEPPFPTLFHPLTRIWEDVLGRNPLPIEDICTSRIPVKDGGLAIYSLNSCMGCGEWRVSVEELEAQKNKIRKADEAKADTFSLYEQLDSPMFTDLHLTVLMNYLDELSTTTVPVILAHHNILPQATARADIYTELLNAGPTRTRLTELDRCIVYCHGHIHSDPIECITTPIKPNASLISIAAPLITAGYNILKFHFSELSQPLGLEVLPHRLKDHGGMIPEKAIKIPFVNHRKPHDRQKELRHLLENCPNHFESIHHIANQIAPQRSVEVIASDLRQLAWYGLVELRNWDSQPEDLRIKRSIL